MKKQSITPSACWKRVVTSASTLNSCCSNDGVDTEPSYCGASRIPAVGPWDQGQPGQDCLWAHIQTENSASDRHVVLLAQVLLSQNLQSIQEAFLTSAGLPMLFFVRRPCVFLAGFCSCTMPQRLVSPVVCSLPLLPHLWGPGSCQLYFSASDPN